MRRGPAVLLVLAALAASGCRERTADPFADVAGHQPVVAASGRVARHGPIVTAAMLPGGGGGNINGPSLVAAPEWLPGRLGRYYLYFSSHRAPRTIRLALADEITGPWRLHGSAVSFTDQGRSRGSARSSPEVVVDHQRRQIRMYFNSRHPESVLQSTLVATSADGLRFEVAPGRLGPSYSRVLRLDGWYYLFLGASGQRVVRSADGISGLETGPQVLPGRRGDVDPYSRHVALQRVGDVLRVFYTRKGDAPERILMGTIDLTQDWRSWEVAGEVEVLRPEMPYEGAELPLRPSRRGPARREGENALRDPAIFEEDGRTWLLYTYAGERGIALAELLF